MSSKYKVGDRVSFISLAGTPYHGTITKWDPQLAAEYYVEIDGITAFWLREKDISPLITASSKYKQGDRVHKHGIRGIVRSSMLGDNDTWRYLVDWDNEWVMSEYVPEHELQLLESPTKTWGKGCECGSRFTDFKDHHMFYCPLYKGN